MKTWSKILILAGIWGGVLGGTIAEASELEVTAAVHAIQQAPDPSAAVAGYANGMAVDRNNPRLHEAYVSRMVDFGLPEMAYRQARTLTTLASTNGLAWSVVAHVDARRGDFPGAISAINLAGRFAVEHPFVQRTAAEILAWHDWAGEQTEVPENARKGLAEVRKLMEKRPAFTAAYETASKAYQAEAQAEPAPTEAEPGAPPPLAPESHSLVETNGAQLYGVPSGVAPGYQGYQSYYPYPYYPSYAYDLGPRWIEPAPWWWWRPVGYFSGVHFVPFTSVLVFHRHGLAPRHRHHFFHPHRPEFKRPGRDHSVDYLLGHSLDSLLAERGRPHNWHGDRQGQRFFGRPVEPSAQAGRSVIEPQPSWSALTRERRIEPSRTLPGRGTVIPRDARMPRRDVQAPQAERRPQTPAASPSWSGLSPQPRVVVPSTPATRPSPGFRGQPVIPSPTTPSWSGMGGRSPGNVVVPRPAPGVGRPQPSQPSTGQSWSGFGRGSSAPTPSAPAARPSPAPSRSGPSWSGFDGR